MTMAAGPVSRVLESEVLGFVRRHGVVCWLDRDGDYTSFVDRLVERARAGEVDVSVAAFRGSWIGWMFDLEDQADGPAEPALLVHLPGFGDEEAAAGTPALEMVETGRRFRKRLDTLVREAATGWKAPAEIDAFLAGGEVTLAAADAWLAAPWPQPADGGDRNDGLDDLSLSVVVEQLLVTDDMLSRRLASTDDGPAALAGFLERHTGMDAAWRRFVLGGRPADRDGLAEALAAWLLSVEYVHDLARPPHLTALAPLAELARPLVERCTEQVRALRRRHPEVYVRLADEAEARLAEEIPHIAPGDLGRIDTFRIEETRVLEGAIAELRAERWGDAADKVVARRGDDAFWVARDRRRRWAWELVDRAAALGEAMAAAPRPLAGLTGHEEAVAAYVHQGAAVDRAHRRFEQAIHDLLEPALPHFTELRTVADDLRAAHTAWADVAARDFTELCRRIGFLPPPGLRQRMVFEDAVRPLLMSGDDKVALLLVDALRLEMAEELKSDLAGPGLKVEVRPRLAELPTVTAVGMNVLAPVAGTDSRLRPVIEGGVFRGFRTGEFTVRTPKDRARAIGERISGRAALQLDLDAVAARPADTLKRRLAQSRLVMVTGREIDEAGEAGLGIAHFDRAMRQVRAAVEHLLAAGVRHVVVTADHGFLLLHTATPARPLGGRREPSRRHVIGAEPRSGDGMVSVPLSALGYDGAEGHLILSEDTRPFETSGVPGRFVHGGNSPQERIVPLLTVSRRRPTAAARNRFELTGEALSPLLNHQRMRLHLHLARGENEELGFVPAGPVAIALRVPDRPDIEIVVKDVSGGSVKDGAVALRPGGEAVEVVFSITGPRDERVRVEAYHPYTEAVEPLKLNRLFEVAGTSAAATVVPVGGRAHDDAWLGAIGDSGARRAFDHLARHDVLDEAELVALLGSPRAARRFDLALDRMLEQVPFDVRVETTPAGKRYVRQEG